MINLLPTEIKHEIRFARINARLLRYLWLTVGVTAVLGLLFGGTIVYLNIVSANTSRDLASAKAATSSYAAFTKEATGVNQRIAAIKAIATSQTHFSLLLSDLAKVLPQGTSLTGITLTGDATKPVELQVNAKSYDQALAVRNAIATSPRVLGADLVSITAADNGYTAIMVIGFKPGAAR